MNNYKVLDGNYFDIENSFYLRSGTERIGKLLSHYEIYKSIAHLPGDVMELGVFKGASLVRWATFRNLLESQDSRKVYGFDPFGAFPVGHVDIDSGKAFAESHDSGSGFGISKEDLEAALEQKMIKNVELVKGDVFDTLPEFLEHHPHLRISLLHLDMDIFEPTQFALEQLWDRLVKGGALVIDDYNAVEGATDAVDKFFADKPYTSMTKAKFSQVPTIIVK